MNLSVIAPTIKNLSRACFLVAIELKSDYPFAFPTA